MLYLLQHADPAPSNQIYRINWLLQPTQPTVANTISCFFHFAFSLSTGAVMKLAQYTYTVQFAHMPIYLSASTWYVLYTSDAYINTICHVFCFVYFIYEIKK